jgi:alpha-1,2-mannosyltransferase
MLMTKLECPDGNEDSALERKPLKIPPLWLFLTVLGSIPATFLFGQDWVDLRGMNMVSGHVWGRDFVNVWTGGHLVIEGRSDMMYSLRDYVAYQRELAGPVKPHYYSYPPTSLFLAAPFGLLPYLAALVLWVAGTLVLFAWAARPYVRDVPNFPILFAVVTPAALINIWAGHYGFLIGALWLACFARIERQPGRAGAFAALLTIKPHLGLLLPPLLLARRKWRTIAVAAAGSVAMVLLSVAAFGLDLWVEYATKMSRFQASLLEDKLSFFLGMMPGTYVSLGFSGLGETAAWALHVCVATAAAFMVWRAERNGANFTDFAFISATATFLILPYAFNYDMTVVCLGFALMLFRHWDSLPIWQRAALIAGYLTPQMTFLHRIFELPITPAALLIGLYAQLRLCAPKAQSGRELSLAIA